MVMIRYQGDADISSKVVKYIKTMGIINNMLKPSLVQRPTQLQLYKALVLPVLCHKRESLTTRKQEINRIAACEMRSMQRQWVIPNGITEEMRLF